MSLPRKSLNRRRPPEIEKVFKCDAHRYVIAWPAENPYVVYDICPVPYYYISQFISPSSHFLYKRNVKGYSPVFPPHVRDIYYAMSFFFQERKQLLKYVAHGHDVFCF